LKIGWRSLTETPAREMGPARLHTASEAGKPGARATDGDQVAAAAARVAQV
jgi:hypothetical protein